MPAPLFGSDPLAVTDIHMRAPRTGSAGGLSLFPLVVCQTQGICWLLTAKGRGHPLTDKLPAFAFAGSAMSGAGANMVENLLDWLPAECILYVPRAIPKDTPLRDLRAWLEDAYEDEDVIRTDNVLESLNLTGAPDYGHVLQLCLLYNPDNPEDQELVKAAYEYDIQVHDICNGMYAIPLPGEPPSEAELPQVPEMRGVPRQVQDDPPWLPDEYKADAVEAFPEAAAGTPAPSLVLPQDEYTLTRNILEGIRALVREELAAMGLTPGMNKIPAVSGEPSDEVKVVLTGPADQPVGSPATTPALPAATVTRRYTRDADGNHKPRTRGRLRAGLTQVELTDAEAEALRADGKLTD